jgi:hypothetical protein
MRALSSANLLGNHIGIDQAKALATILKEHSTLKSLCGIADDATEADLSCLGMDADDAIVLASELPDKGALSSLSLKNNRLATKEAGRALATALAANSVLKELDLSSNAWAYSDYDHVHADGAGFAQELAVGIKDNGAISKLIFNGGVTERGRWVEGGTVTLESSMTDANFSNKKLGVPGAMIISAWLSSGKDKGALLRLDMSSNKINFNMNGEAAAAPGTALSDALAVNTVLTELDLSNNYLKPEFARELAVGVRDNGAMTSLDISDNRLCGLLSDGSGSYDGAGVGALSEMLKANSSLRRLNMSKNYLGPEGAKVMSVGLSDNGAMTSLNLASNALCGVSEYDEGTFDATGI